MFVLAKDLRRYFSLGSPNVHSNPNATKPRAKALNLLLNRNWLPQFPPRGPGHAIKNGAAHTAATAIFLGQVAHNAPFSVPTHASDGLRGQLVMCQRPPVPLTY